MTTANNQIWPADWFFSERYPNVTWIAPDMWAKHNHENPKPDQGGEVIELRKGNTQ